MSEPTWSPEMGESDETRSFRFRMTFDGGRWYLLSWSSNDGDHLVTLESVWHADTEWKDNFLVSTDKPQLAAKLWQQVPRRWELCRELLAGEWDSAREGEVVDKILLA